MVYKNFGKEIGSKNILGPKKCWSKKLWVQKSLDVKKKFCPQIIGLKSLVKISTGTEDILLVCKNVPEYMLPG